MMSASRSKVTVLIAVACFVAVTVSAPAISAGGYRRSSRRIGPGVHHISIYNPKGPWHIDVVSVKLSARSTVDVALARDTLRGFETVSSMARRHGAIAATNADFTLPTGRPVNTFAEDGHFVQTSLAPYGLTMMVAGDESGATMRHQLENVRLWTPHGKKHHINKVNAGAARHGGLALFTRFGDGLEKTPKKACAARLTRSTAYGFRTKGKNTVGKYRVDKVACRRRRLQRRSGVVVATARDSGKARAIRKLDRGERVKISWNLGWDKPLFDTVGGNPYLVVDGKNVAPAGTVYPYTRQPRTGIGKTRDGRFLLVTVDGRQPGYSVGMTFARFAKLFKDLGATRALNLDGGNSSETWVRGEVKSSPSGGAERPTSTAVLVLPGGDRGGLPASALGRAGSWPGLQAQASSGPPSLAALGRDIMADPGSTGGLALLLKDQGYALPPVLERAAEGLARR